jgi:hypothetical protein
MRFLLALSSLLFLTLRVSAETSKTNVPVNTTELLAEVATLPTCVVRMTIESLQPCLSYIADNHGRPHA